MKHPCLGKHNKLWCFVYQSNGIQMKQNKDNCRPRTHVSAKEGFLSNIKLLRMLELDLFLKTQYLASIISNDSSLKQANKSIHYLFQIHFFYKLSMQKKLSITIKKGTNKSLPRNNTFGINGSFSSLQVDKRVVFKVNFGWIEI